MKNQPVKFYDRILSMQKNVQTFLTESTVGLLSTYNDLKPHGVPVFYLFKTEEKAFYFITKTESRKYINLAKNGVASFTIFCEKPPTVFTAECHTEILEFSFEKYSAIIKKLIDMHSTQDYHPSPISIHRKGLLKLIKLKISDFHYRSYQKTGV
jgi:hypothetical protein